LQGLRIKYLAMSQTDRCRLFPITRPESFSGIRGSKRDSKALTRCRAELVVSSSPSRFQLRGGRPPDFFYYPWAASNGATRYTEEVAECRLINCWSHVQNVARGRCPFMPEDEMDVGSAVGAIYLCKVWLSGRASWRRVTPRARACYSTKLRGAISRRSESDNTPALDHPLMRAVRISESGSFDLSPYDGTTQTFDIKLTAGSTTTILYKDFALIVKRP